MNDAIDASMMDADRLEQVTTIVSAFVSNNALPPSDLTQLIVETHKALQSLSIDKNVPLEEKLEPAVSIRKSITPDFLICLDDGKKFKSLRRHLAVLGMTPEEYRSKWDLPSDYPMVAPNYSAVRSSMAKSNGLGRKAEAKPVAPLKRTKKSTIDA